MLMITFSHITGIYNTKTFNISVGETESAKYLTSSDVDKKANVNIDIQENLQQKTGMALFVLII